MRMNATCEKKIKNRAHSILEMRLSYKLGHDTCTVDGHKNVKVDTPCAIRFLSASRECGVNKDAYLLDPLALYCIA
jgi:hypothetical protein